MSFPIGQDSRPNPLFIFVKLSPLCNPSSLVETRLDLTALLTPFQPWDSGIASVPRYPAGLQPRCEARPPKLLSSCDLPLRSAGERGASDRRCERGAARSGQGPPCASRVVIASSCGRRDLCVLRPLFQLFNSQVSIEEMACL